MTKRRLRASWLLTIAILAGCAAPGGPARPKASVAVVPAKVPDSTVVTSQRPGDPLPSAVVAATLAGDVKAPPEIISDNGGSVISNNGGSFISKSKLIDQAAVAGAVVRLYKASGEAVAGPDGHPVSALTDASGHYAFTQPLPAGPLVVQAEVPGTADTLKALSVPADGARAATTSDVVSTLTTVYILEKFLKGQPDPDVRLARLPAQVEAETRARAASAIGTSVLPDARTPERVVAAVESLRQATPAFEQQMTVVHDLLLAAGQVNLGQGRPALDVVFGGLGALAVAADGTLYLDAIDDSRIWRMGADGTVQTVAGRGGAGDRLAADGLSALDVYLYHPVGFALDPQGRVVVAESTSQSPFGPYIFPPSDDHAALYRLDAQGRIEMLWQPGKGEHQWPRVVAPDAAGNVQVLNIRGEVEAWPSEHWTIGPDKARRMVRRFSTADGDVLYRSLIWGHDAQGRFYMAEPVQAPKSNTLVYRYDPARDGLEQLADGLKENLAGLTVTAGGEILALKADRSLELRLPDGTRRTVLAKLPPEYGVDLNAAALAPDGTLYVVLDKGPFPGRTVLGPGRTYAFEDALVFRIRDGALTQVAGTEGTRRSGPATDLALLEPHGAAGGPDGRMYVADGPANRIWVVDANKQAVPFAGTGETGEAGDGGPAASAQVSDPNVPHVDAAGNVTWIESDSRLRTATPAGVIATRYVPTRGHYLQDLAIAPDGTAYFLEQPSIDGSDPFELRKLPPGAKTATVLSNAAELKGATSLALAPDGSVYVTGGKDHDTYYTGYLLRWSAAKGVERLSTDPRYYTSEDEAGLAVAADGKVYVTGYLKYDETALMRYDPATGALEVLTGDDGLLSKEVDVEAPGYPSIDPDGNLLMVDTNLRTILRVEAARLRGR